MSNLVYLYPLLSAASFATSSVIIRDLDRIGSPLFLNLLRTLTGAILYIVSLFLFGFTSDLLELSGLVILYLVLSVLFNVVIGDTFYFKSQTILGVKIATPIVNVYPFVTILLSSIFLAEKFDDNFLIGGFLIIVGIIILSQEIQDDEIRENGFTSRDKMIALLLAFGSVLMYALGIFFTTLGSEDLNVNVANSVRLPSGAFLLLIILLVQPYQSNTNTQKVSLREQFRKLSTIDTSDKIKIFVAGLLGTYISSLFLVLSTQELGAGKTAVLTSTGPLFALPLAIYWLHEKVGKMTIIGTILSLVGLWMSIS
ncbi:MAG: DMT family transporter [Candidatus Heimdallarchaeota archaeon]|nr:DMT family transporter [Candidatus Heimdallarchaeota archaeon]